ncbi:MAG: class I SAM-dependent methyltransferase [Gammaproteobacteria bacterium]|nr:class I SAM-dependent methyltransferase [Gammaproteobacteria bacterium]
MSIANPVQNIAGQPDITAIKAKMKATWMDGDYALFARYMEPGALRILEEWDIAPNVQLLDVGCGAGQIAIPAARAGVKVTGADIADNLIAHARKRAEQEGLSAHFEIADAEDLPYDEASFDAVTSLIGAMFAPQPLKVAAEFARVCRSGGRLAMANWTPNGLVGKMFKVISAHVPPPPGVAPAPLWGDEDTVTQRLQDGFTDIQLTRKDYTAWRYPLSVPEVVTFFFHSYGPTKRAFAALDTAGQMSLREGLIEVFAAHNVARDGSTEFHGAEYLDVRAIRR